MGIKEKSIATLWYKYKGKGNYIIAKVSTRKKRSDTGEYITDFKGDVRLIGKAKELSEKCKSGTVIKIKECEITNYITKSGNIKYNILVYDFDIIKHKEER